MAWSSCLQKASSEQKTAEECRWSSSFTKARSWCRWARLARKVTSSRSRKEACGSFPEVSQIGLVSSHACPVARCRSLAERVGEHKAVIKAALCTTGVEIRSLHRRTARAARRGTAVAPCAWYRVLGFPKTWRCATLLLQLELPRDNHARVAAWSDVAMAESDLALTGQNTGNNYAITNESRTTTARVFFAQGCEVDIETNAA